MLVGILCATKKPMSSRPISIRLYPEDFAVLDALVKQDKATLESVGIAAEVNYATVIRRLLKSAKPEPKAKATKDKK